MLQELMLGLAVGFAFVLGPLLGNWTSDEGHFIKKTGFARFLRKFTSILAVLYAFLLWFASRISQTELASLVLFGLILTQASITTTRKLDKKSLISGFVFVAVFFVFSFFK